MQYQALYRKYRPQQFSEVVGQEHVTTTLAREVIEDKVAHAYLFTGPRGTGKTTSARLLAKSLNCPNRTEDGEPCNTCPSCISITEGTSLDVIELDAASHNKVEDVREIRVNVGTVAAAAGARRVYILDEAHMLSRAAGNALLKTLEEPPEHVVFVLATTEPYKLLDTIRSRSQRFDFHPVATEVLIAHIADISDREGFVYDHAALGAITSHAGGSVRDALSLLEQVAALGAGEVTTAGVARALGLADRDAYDRLVQVIVESDAGGALILVSEMARQGADLRRFVADAIAYMRGVFLSQYTANVDDVVDESRETIQEWQRAADAISSTEVLRTIDELSAALLQIREGREERLVVELALLRLTKPEVVADLESLTARVERTERELREIQRGGAATIQAPKPPPVVPEDPTEPFAPAQESVTEPIDEDPPSAPPTEEPTDEPEQSESAVASETPVVATRTVTLEEFEGVWPAIVATIRSDVGPRRHALLREAEPTEIVDGVVVFEVAEYKHFHLEQLKADEGIAQAITTLSEEKLGTPLSVSFRAGPATPKTEDSTDRIPDKEQLVAHDGEDEPDAASLLLDVLGGEIVSE
ncbi:MAG: DNA polymerase III subunit gamma/tau [Acidimicrobiia bacterium]